jgi:hypothetical protein
LANGIGHYFVTIYRAFGVPPFDKQIHSIGFVKASGANKAARPAGHPHKDGLE